MKHIHIAALVVAMTSCARHRDIMATELATAAKIEATSEIANLQKNLDIDLIITPLAIDSATPNQRGTLTTPLHITGTIREKSKICRKTIDTTAINYERFQHYTETQNRPNLGTAGKTITATAIILLLLFTFFAAKFGRTEK